MSYRRLLTAYLRPQWPAALLMALCLLAGIGLQLVAPQVVRRFLDEARAGAAEPVLLRAAALFLAVSAAQGVARVLAGYWSERVAWTATNALRADLTAHLLRLDAGFHQRRTPGELIERVDGDVNALAGFFSTFVVQLAGNGLLLLGILGALFAIDPRLGAAFAALAGATLALLGRVRRAGTPHWQADRERSARFYGYLGEALGATEDLRAGGAVPYALRRFFEELRGWLPVRRRAGLWGQAVMMAAIVAFGAADAAAFGLGAWLHRLGAVSLGTVYAVVAYAAMLAEPIERIREEMQHLQQADAGIARIRQLLETRPRLADGVAALPGGPLAVDFERVTFAYEAASEAADDAADEAQPALRDVSFRLEPGAVLGVLGRTGSGKSTLARLLFRQHDPQGGAVRLGGVDLRRARLASVRARVGLVTQDVQLFAASLRDNVTFFDPSVPERRLREVLERLGLAAWLARLPGGLEAPIAAGRLSAGEAQLVALARVFLKDPGVVVLDEASSRLDPETQALLERALDALLAGKTAIVIAHRLETLERADELLVLEDGAVVERGPRRALAADARSHLSRLRRAGAVHAAGLRAGAPA